MLACETELGADPGSGSNAGLTEYKSAARRLRLDSQSLEVRGPSPDLGRYSKSLD